MSVEPLSAGQTLRQFRIEGQVGAGGMGVVYRAWDTKLERWVALKLIDENLLPDASSRERLLAEARIASGLNHPNICTVYEVGEAEGRTYIAMEYLDGKSLSALVPPHGLPHEIVLRYGIEIADAVAHAHERQVIHRDLKGANVIVTQEGRVKLLDFSLSQLLRETQVPGTTQAAKKTSSSGRPIAGTLHYMAPEVLRGEVPDVRSDVWSLGILLFEMTSGDMPFQGQTGFELASAILRDPPKSLPPRVLPGLRSITLRCLAKDPTQRFQRSGELRAALHALQEELVGGRVPRRGLLRRLALAGAASVLVSVFIIWRAWPPRKPIDSLAVLPISNGSPGDIPDYLPAGITQTLINNLSHLPEVRVISWDTVSRVPRGGGDAASIGRKLGVRAVLTGTLVKRGDTFALSAELVDTAGNGHLWGGQFDRPSADVPDLLRQVSQEISDTLQPQLATGPGERAAKRYTESAEAYDLYLRGRYHWGKRTEEELNKAVAFFKQAIQKDPKYALAWAGLADSYALLASLGGPEALSPNVAMPEAKAAALTALKMDDSLAEAHASLASTLHNYDWDWAGAEKEFKRAIQLNPNYAIAHHWYAHYLIQVGRIQESLDESQQALKLDPMSIFVNSGLARMYYLARQYDRAVERCQKALEIEPNFFGARIILGMAYVQQSRFGEAIAEFERSRELAGNLLVPSDREQHLRVRPEFPLIAALLGHAYAVSGDKARAQLELAKLGALASRRYVPPYCLTLVYAGLGDRNHALEWLERACRERSEVVLYLKVEPDADPLRADPRFQALLERIGFP